MGEDVSPQFEEKTETKSRTSSKIDDPHARGFSAVSRAPTVQHFALYVRLDGRSMLKHDRPLIYRFEISSRNTPRMPS